MFSLRYAYLALDTGIMFLRSDLWRDALWSGVLFLCITFLAYLPVLVFFPDFISAFWHFENINDVLFLGVPLEEFLWAFTFGLVVGPFYEWWLGMRLKALV